MIVTPPEYTVPLISNNEENEGFGWFALSNLKQTEIKRGDYQLVNGMDTTDSMSGNIYMIYISI